MYVISCLMLTYKKVGIKNKSKIGYIKNTLLFLIFFQLSIFVSGQDSINDASYLPPRQVKIVTVIDFYTTFAGIQFINGQTSNEKNSLYLYYNLIITNKVNAGKFMMTNYYFTEFGFKKFIDSITTISEDQYNFKNNLSYRFGKSRFAFNIVTNSKSQYFRHKDYKADSSGVMVPYLYTSFLSPGYNNLSAGIKYDAGDYYTIEFGLVNGRKTRIKNQAIFESRSANKLYGLEKGEVKKMEFGLNLILTIPSHEIAKNLYFENFSQFNVNRSDIKSLKYYKADINNAFHFKFLKHFRLTLRTKFLYDINANPKPMLVNSFTIGFYLNNTF
jgi:hypothetical protein